MSDRLPVPPSPSPLDPAAGGTVRRRRGATLLTLAATVAVLWGLKDVVDADTLGAWVRPGERRFVQAQLWVYWGCWLLWPLLGWQVLGLRRVWRAPQSGPRRRAVPLAWRAAVLVATACVLWGRFIEPHLLQVHQTKLSSTCGVRIALVSDVHLGIFGRTDDLARLVGRLNALEVDAVLMAGDWTIAPPHELAPMLAPLSGLRHPLLSVTGNHDEEAPGPPLTEALRQTLKSLGVENLEARRRPLGRCEFVGLGDLSAGGTAQHLASLAAEPSDVPAARRVVLVHNPDAAFELPEDYAAWVLAGHIHGGQVRLPFLTDWMLDRMTFGRFRPGLRNLPHTRVFVTSGVGMSNLPFRFGVPPVIDLLDL